MIGNSVRVGHAAGRNRGQHSFPTRILDRLIDWQGRAHQRHALAGLSDRMLKDVGLDRATTTRESSQPFWRT